MPYETVAYVTDPSIVRVLLAALQAHGFHPRESGASGIAGFSGYYGPKGFPVELPEDEAGDGRILAEALVREMTAR